MNKGLACTAVAVAAACLLALSGCGGSMGPDPASDPPAGTSHTPADPPAGATTDPPSAVTTPSAVTHTAPPIAAIGAYSLSANIGINVEGVSYYDTAQQYVDVIRMAGAWYPTPPVKVKGVKQTLAQLGELDTNGWPEEDASIMLVSGGAASGSAADPGPGSYLLGKYHLSFNGKAKLYDDGGTVEDQTYDPATNTTTATATLDQHPLGSAGTIAEILLSFSQTQRTASSATNTGITNVHVIRPQFAPNGMKWWDSPTQEFTDPFLASLAPFSTLRLMDWGSVIGNQQADWDQRTPADWPGQHYIETNGVWQWNNTDKKTELTDNVWSITGQSWQSMIDLANVTGKDIWINIPARATDDYVKSLATLLKQKLNPGIHVYVEYSNEVWNYGYKEWYYNNATTKALLADNSQAAAEYQKNCVSWANDTCHVAERLMQISRDFANVWGGPAINAAIRPVFCWQTGSSAMQVALAFINNVYGPPAKYFYAVCSAPYWKPATITNGESVNDLLAASAASIPNRDGSLLVYTVAARFYGLHNFAYEGGPGMSGSVDLPNMITANADPRMGQQVTRALTGAFQNGLDMYMYFISSGGWSKYGMWGATTDIFDLTQTKWQALQALAGKNITRTLAVTDPTKGPRPGTTLPGTINAGHPVFHVVAGALEPLSRLRVAYCIKAAKGLPVTCSAQSNPSKGNSEYGYLAMVPKAGTYTVTLKLDGRRGTTASSAQFYVNQKPQGGTIAIPASPKGTPSAPASFTVTLPAGISLIELEATSGSFLIDSIVVTGSA